MSHLIFVRPLQLGLVLMLCACSSLLPKPEPQPAIYALDNVRTEHPAVTTSANITTALPVNLPTLIVSMPRAAAGFDSQRMMYTRAAHQLEYFAHSEWVDTPARMLAPLIVSAVERSNAFRAVAATPSAVLGDIRLDTEVVRLQQNFDVHPGNVRFTLRAYVVDNATRRVLSWREFDETVATVNDDPVSGVVAANQVVQIVLEKLAALCVESAANWAPQNP